MKFGVPWSRKGVRPQTNAASEVARHSDPLPAERPDTIASGAALNGTAPSREQRQPEFDESPDGLDRAIAEIAARQRALDSEPPRGSSQNIAALEQQLRQIDERIAALRRPCAFDDGAGVLRAHLAEIAKTLNDAMPRQALQALEQEVRRLAERFDQARRSGADAVTVSGIERGLGEVRDALRAFTPAENLIGLDHTVGALARKLDAITDPQHDPAILLQIESAIDGLRNIVAHVASNDALNALAGEVRSLAAKIDRVASAGDGNALTALESRIAMLADALEARGHNADVVAPQVVFGQLESRIADLVKRLDASNARAVQLEAIERGMVDLLVFLEEMRAAGAGTPLRPSTSQATPDTETLGKDIAELKESERRAQDSLENMHGTIGHLIDRLAMIEQDLHDSAAAPKTPPMTAADIPQPAPSPAQDHAMPATPLPVSPPLLPPEPPPEFEIPADHEAPALEPEAPLPATDASEAPMAPPQYGAPPMATATALAVPSPLPTGDPTFPLTAAPRPPLDPSLPPNHPLEPGSTAGRGRSGALSASDRIAASEAALESTKPPATPERSAKSDFIAAARRAAQAAAADAEERGKKTPAGTAGSDHEPLGARVAKRMRTLFVGAGVAAFALGALHVATKFSEDVALETTQLSSDKDATIATATIPAAPANSIVAPLPPMAEPEPRLTESVPTPTQLAKVPPAERLDILPASKPPATNNAKASSPVVRDVTGTVPLPPEPPLPAPERLQPAVPAVPAPAAIDAQLPPKLGSAPLRIAAINGEPAAAYEIAVRLAEGRRGIAPDLAEAARWFERASSHGLAPAQFRLGSLYEKGQGVRRDLDKATKLYLAAAAQGNTKAMHNLAVLYAEGASGKPDYRMAAQWFRKAANQGLIDSQFNLGILYARGIGVPQNLAESYKWFTLAARDGDTDAAKKRDDLAARLDQQSLMAARLAVQTWTPERPPAEANEVKTPAGGWDAVAAPPKSSIPPSRRPRGGAGVRTPPAG